MSVHAPQIPQETKDGETKPEDSGRRRSSTTEEATQSSTKAHHEEGERIA